MKGRTRAVLALTCCNCLVSCTLHQQAEYPSTWPKIVESADCDDLSGYYKNEALETTLWRSPKLSETARAFLLSYLIEGAPGSL